MLSIISFPIIVTTTAAPNFSARSFIERKNEYKKTEVPVKYFDVTERARAMIVRHANDIDSPEDFISMIKEFDMNTLCPQVEEYPYDEEEVDDLFQDYLWDYL